MNTPSKLLPETRITLDEKSHIYWLDGRQLESVGALVKRVTPVFDASFHASRVAQKQNRTVEAVLAEWSDKRQAGCDSGNVLHDFIKQVLTQPIEPEEAVKQASTPKCKQWADWWVKASKNLKPEMVERIVGSADLGCAGTVDLCAESIKTGMIHVIDWKQNKRFEQDSRYNEYLLAPFDDLQNCELTRYSIQVSAYRLMIEKLWGVQTGESWILHITEEYTAYYRAFDLRSRVEDWIRSLKL